ncbi:MAG TPA: class I SAM-dependent methyltransferase [Myxococcaceae bacterium]|nr:class I SAM-dependent methyltransferase [Myxococcaceae bacterium]
MSGFKDHFSAAASGYAAHRPVYPRAVAEALAARSPGHGLAWDAGCGSGQLSVVLGEVFDQVLATDASAAQIAAATPHPAVRYAVAPAETSGLPDGSVDCAVAAQAAHWFDLHAYYREVRRVARPGGLIALVTYAVMEVDPGVERVVERFYWKTLEGHWPAERKLVEEGYRSLPFPFEPVEAPPLVLEHRWNVEQLLGYVGTWSAVQSLRKAGRGAELDRFGDELRAAWGDPEMGRLIRWPLSLRLGRVTPLL